MAVITKTQGINILSHQAVVHPNTVTGAAQDVSTKVSASIMMFHSSVEAVVNTNPGSFLIQVSASATGDENWVTVGKFTANNTTADDEALTAVEAIGSTVLDVAATTGFVAEDFVYIQDVTTLTNSEWNRLKSITATPASLNLIDGLTRAKAVGDKVWNDADIFIFQISLVAIARLRVVFQHEGTTGANAHIKALMVTGDSIG